MWKYFQSTLLDAVGGDFLFPKWWPCSADDNLSCYFNKLCTHIPMWHVCCCFKRIQKIYFLAPPPSYSLYAPSTSLLHPPGMLTGYRVVSPYPLMPGTSSQAVFFFLHSFDMFSTHVFSHRGMGSITKIWGQMRRMWIMCRCFVAADEPIPREYAVSCLNFQLCRVWG